MIPQIRKEEKRRAKAIKYAKENLDFYEKDNYEHPKYETIIYSAFSRHLLYLLQNDEIKIEDWMVVKWGLILNKEGTLLVAYPYYNSWINIKAPFQVGDIIKQ